VRLANQMVGVDGAGEGIGGAGEGTVAFFICRIENNQPPSTAISSAPEMFFASLSTVC
jgi:hypothetical protein